MRRGARSVLVAGVATVSLVGLASAGLQPGTKSFRLETGEVRERTPDCDRGRATSGGFVAPNAGGPAMYPVDSTREGTRGWRLRVRNIGHPGRATAYVYCAKGLPTLATAASEAVIGSDAAGTLEAVCPKGAEAVAGGFDSPDASTHLLASRRSGNRTWEVRFLNDSNASHTYGALAYCDSSEPGLKARSKTVTTDGNSERVGQRATASCRPSQRLRSGGFEIERDVTGPAHEHNLGLVHASRRRAERSWRITAFSYVGHPQLTAYAYCE